MPDSGLATANPARLDATTAADRIARGRLAIDRLTDACLDVVAAREPELLAWAFIDPAYCRRQARTLIDGLAKGQTPGRLLGVPVGVKDIFATADMPTANGTALHAGRQPAADSAVVERLRAAGAIVLGKTVTTELAAFTPGPTRNPHDPTRTPGGSSSGSAAAVAANMVPLAIGSQTNGSVIRPASYCGVYGFKPSFGLISRRGMTLQSPTVDHVGVFARRLADAALLVEVLAGYDSADPAMRHRATPPLVAAALAGRTRAPRLALIDDFAWETPGPSTLAVFDEIARALAGVVDRTELPPGFAAAKDVHQSISWAELAHELADLHAAHPEGLSDGLRAMIEWGQRLGAGAYLAALAERRRLQAAVLPLFDEFDAILTPAAAGEAPVGLGSTGSPGFCTLWSLLGTPAVCLPLRHGPSGMPLGVQLVGRLGEDAKLLATAAWLEQALAPGS